MYKELNFRVRKSKKIRFFFVLWMSLSFVWFKFTHTLCTIVLNSIIIYTRNTIRLHFHFLFMRLSHWWYYLQVHLCIYTVLGGCSLYLQKKKNLKRKNLQNFQIFYVCPIYPRQPNRKVNLNIKSSNTKIIWFSRF